MCIAIASKRRKRYARCLCYVTYEVVIGGALPLFLDSHDATIHYWYIIVNYSPRLLSRLMMPYIAGIEGRAMMMSVALTMVYLLEVGS